jgi:hypothetical protein
MLQLSPSVTLSTKKTEKTFLGMIGCPASIHENTAKHRKDPEKHPETTPTNVSSKTVAIQ